MRRIKKSLQQYATEHGLRGQMLINEYDESNKRPISKIAYGSSKSAVWTCSICGYQWEALVVNRTCHEGMCPNCRAEHTSGDEQILFYLLKRELTPLGYSVYNRYKINGKEVDVYVPALRFGVELDGAFWHSAKYKQKIDEEKHKFFRGAGLDVVRVIEGKEETAEGIRCDLRFSNITDRSLLVVRKYLQAYIAEHFKIRIDPEMTEDEIFLSRLAARKPKSSPSPGQGMGTSPSPSTGMGTSPGPSQGMGTSPSPSTGMGTSPSPSLGPGTSPGSSLGPGTSSSPGSTPSP